MAAQADRFSLNPLFTSWQSFLFFSSFMVLCCSFFFYTKLFFMLSHAECSLDIVSILQQTKCIHFRSWDYCREMVCRGCITNAMLQPSQGLFSLQPLSLYSVHLFFVDIKVDHSAINQSSVPNYTVFLTNITLSPLPVCLFCRRLSFISS